MQIFGDEISPVMLRHYLENASRFNESLYFRQSSDERIWHDIFYDKQSKV